MAKGTNHSEPITLNGIYYDLELAIGGANITPRSINYGQITGIAITNDLLSYKSGIVIQFIDRSAGILTDVDATSSTLVQFGLSCSSKRFETAINSTYTIDHSPLINHEGSNTEYAILASHNASLRLQKQVAIYEENLAPTDILKKIFASINLTLITKDDHTTNKRVTYISDQNMSVRQQIEDLCNLMSFDVGPTYVAFNMETENYMTVCPTKKFDEKMYRKYILTGSTDAVTTDQAANVIEYHEEITGFDVEKARELFNEKKIWEFNHQNRKWTNTEFKFDKIKKLLSNTEAAHSFSYEQQEWEQNTPYVKGAVYSPNDREIGRNLREAFISARVLVCKVIGDLFLDAGKFILLDGGDVLNKKYGGVWLIVSVIHRIERGTFVTEMKLSRAYSLKSQERNM